MCDINQNWNWLKISIDASFGYALTVILFNVDRYWILRPLLSARWMKGHFMCLRRLNYTRRQIKPQFPEIPLAIEEEHRHKSQSGNGTRAFWVSGSDDTLYTIAVATSFRINFIKSTILKITYVNYLNNKDMSEVWRKR